jgi:predicted Kef-type K+ transport protein
LDYGVIELLIIGIALMFSSTIIGLKLLLQRQEETPETSLEVGVKLGQISEFYSLIAVLALDLKLIGLRPPMCTSSVL